MVVYDKGRVFPGGPIVARRVGMKAVGKLAMGSCSGLDMQRSSFQCAVLKKDSSKV